MVKRQIEIEQIAKNQLRQAYQYIRKDSPQNADKVRKRILETIKVLAENPEHHPLDKYCIKNDGNYRVY